MLCFHGTLIKGGGLGECYIISGGGSVVLLYNIIWGGWLSKNEHFLLYNMWMAANKKV